MTGLAVTKASLTFVGTPPLTAPSSVVTVDSDSGWSWFSGPEAICRGRKLYYGVIRGTQNANDAAIIQRDLDTNAQTSFALHAAFERDDHDNPGIAFLGDGRIFAAYARHNDSVMSYRISTNPGDISAWGSEQTITYPNPAGIRCTYANPFYLTTPSRLYLGARGNNAYPALTYSDDEGGTWATPADFWVPISGQRAYMRYVSNGTDTLHFFGTAGHPREVTSGACHLYHAYLKAGQFYKSDGTPTKSLATVMGGSPLVASDLTKIYDASEESGSALGGNAWTWSIQLDSGGNPHVAFTTFPTVDQHRYHWGRWDGTQWVKSTVVANAGPSLYGLSPQAEEEYSYGVTLDTTDPRIVWAVIANAGGTAGELWKFRTLDNGATWQSVQVTSGTVDKQWRPVAPRNPVSGAPQVLVNEGSYGNFASWISVLKAWF